MLEPLLATARDWAGVGAACVLGLFVFVIIFVNPRLHTLRAYYISGFVIFSLISAGALVFLVWGILDRDWAVVVLSSIMLAIGGGTLRAGWLVLHGRDASRWSLGPVKRLLVRLFVPDP